MLDEDITYRIKISYHVCFAGGGSGSSIDIKFRGTGSSLGSPAGCRSLSLKFFGDDSVDRLEIVDVGLVPTAYMAKMRGECSFNHEVSAEMKVQDPRKDGEYETREEHLAWIKSELITRMKKQGFELASEIK